GALRVDAAVDHGWRRARAGAAVRLVEPRGIAMHPHRRAGGEVVARDDLVVAALLLRVDEVAVDRERRPSGADLPPPQFNRRRLPPVAFDLQAPDDAVAIRAAEARPDR